MDVSALHERILRGRKTVLVVCQRQQQRPDVFGKVRLYDLSRADRRELAQRIEDEEYERVVGYFDHRVSLADFTAACEAQCRKVREIENYAESLLRFPGTEPADHGILTDEYIASLMDAGKGWASDFDSGYAGETEGDWDFDSAVAEGAGRGGDNEIRTVSGLTGEGGGEPDEGGDSWDKLGYL